MTETKTSRSDRIRYQVTGRVAHSRIVPLLPSHWIDYEDDDDESIPNFLWENAPRAETKPYRDEVQCYSHLPNGTHILDSKWVLARLFQSDKSALESHCFRGYKGFENFWESRHATPATAAALQNWNLPDLMNKTADSSSIHELSKAPPNFWVVKDAMSNGAGGIWMVGPENAHSFASPNGPLSEDHRYVAQAYAWPPILYHGRKCHVRVYGLLTSDGRAFVHSRCFLHVANHKFQYTTTQNTFAASVHITNCCANSHDDSKFAGEILADLQQIEPTTNDVVALGDFAPSIQAAVADLAQRTRPFLLGGQAHCGFEYLGMDFILSYKDGQPVAYLLEVNAPPSQDTATGLPHAEDLHDTVLRDLISLWVLPSVTHCPEVPGGWICVFRPPVPDEDTSIVPSKAALLNKIRWALLERKAAAVKQATTPKLSSFASFVRSHFVYYSNTEPPVFLENAGGSQVPTFVVDAMTRSLQHRHRTVVGSQAKLAARNTLASLLGATRNESIFLGANASTLLSKLAHLHVRHGLLNKGDEIVIATENHLANVTPWLEAAEATGAHVKWWTQTDLAVADDTILSSRQLKDLLTGKTRIVALPHASNILGQVRDIEKICQQVETQTKGYARVVVDGVATAPHMYSNVSNWNVDWYAVSCHKIFAPHLGVLCGSRSAVDQLETAAVDSRSFGWLETGTINYEACAGIQGLGTYFASLASFEDSSSFTKVTDEKASDHRLLPNRQCRQTPNQSTHEMIPKQYTIVSQAQVQDAYRKIAKAEALLLSALLRGIGRSNKVTVVEGRAEESVARLPVVSFVHSKVSGKDIVKLCEASGIVCRHSTFLSTDFLAREYGFDDYGGVVRMSLAHYNTMDEIELVLNALESIPGWF